jgi:hypothetical protein
MTTVPNNNQMTTAQERVLVDKPDGLDDTTRTIH